MKKKKKKKLSIIRKKSLALVCLLSREEFYVDWHRCKLTTKFSRPSVSVRKKGNVDLVLSLRQTHNHTRTHTRREIGACFAYRLFCCLLSFILRDLLTWWFHMPLFKSTIPCYALTKLFLYFFIHFFFPGFSCTIFEMKYLPLLLCRLRDVLPCGRCDTDRLKHDFWLWSDRFWNWNFKMHSNDDYCFVSWFTVLIFVYNISPCPFKNYLIFFPLQIKYLRHPLRCHLNRKKGILHCRATWDARCVSNTNSNRYANIFSHQCPLCANQLEPSTSPSPSSMTRTFYTVSYPRSGEIVMTGVGNLNQSFCCWFFLFVCLFW